MALSPQPLMTALEDVVCADLQIFGAKLDAFDNDVGGDHTVVGAQDYQRIAHIAGQLVARYHDNQLVRELCKGSPALLELFENAALERAWYEQRAAR